MPFAVLQKELIPPTGDQLREAFRDVPGLTAADAQILRADAFGILVRSFPLERARKLQEGLAAQGYEAEVVDEKAMPALPVTRFVQRLDCAADGLLVYDTVGRATTLPYADVLLVAAGRVRLSDFVRRVVAEPIVRFDGDGMPRAEETTHTEYKEEKNFHLLLELILAPSRRLSAAADRFNFIALGERKTQQLAENFKLFTQDLLRAAPHATVNSGAHYIRENAGRFFEYPSKNAFFEEITWLLWRIQEAGTAG